MITYLPICGTPQERGHQYGEAARDKIASNLGIYEAWFETIAGVSWQHALEECSKFLALLEKEAVELVKELYGIAEGAGRDIEEIVALNARTEIAYGVSGILDVSECTSIGVSPDGSADRHVYIAENWDWIPDTLPNTILLHVTLPDGLQLLTFTEAGMLAKFGVNSAGIALCNNLLASNQNQIGQTFHTLSRSILQSDSLLSALQSLTSATRAGSGNFMIGTEGGDVIDLEWAPTDFHLFYATDGYLAHTNHFVASLYAVRDRLKIMKTASPGTLLRLARADKFLRENKGAIDSASLQEILRNHEGQPEAICRHGEASELHASSMSNISVIFDLTGQELHYTVGAPCSTDYRVLPFPWADSAEHSAWTELTESDLVTIS